MAAFRLPLVEPIGLSAYSDKELSGGIGMRSAQYVLLLGLFLCAAISGCGSKPPPPTLVELTIAAGPGINPEPDGRPSPVILRVYQLGSIGAFEKADFFQLYDKENAALGTDLIGRDQVVLEPGASKTLKFELKPMAKFVGIMAAFRNIDQSEWRADAEIPPNKTTKLTVTVDKLSIKIAPAGS